MADIYIYFPSMPAGYIRGTIEFDLEDLVQGAYDPSRWPRRWGTSVRLLNTKFPATRK